MVKKIELWLNDELIGEYSSVAETMVAFDVLSKNIGWLPPSTTSEGMFYNAESFRKAGELLLESNGKSPFFIVPGVVNSTFAIELYLKVLAEAHGTPLRGHDLLILFDSLPAAASDVVARKILDPKAPDDAISLVEFREVIKEFRHAFVRWRYVDGLTPAGSVTFKQMRFVIDVLCCCCGEALSITKGREVRRRMRQQTIQIRTSNV